MNVSHDDDDDDDEDDQHTHQRQRRQQQLLKLMQRRQPQLVVSRHTVIGFLKLTKNVCGRVLSLTPSTSVHLRSRRVLGVPKTFFHNFDFYFSFGRNVEAVLAVSAASKTNILSSVVVAPLRSRPPFFFS